MTALVFVDTNVLLYAQDESEPAKRPRAQAWLEHLWQERLGRTSMQVLSECYVNLKRMAGPRLVPHEAWESVSRYFAWKPLASDDAPLRRARKKKNATSPIGGRGLRGGRAGRSRNSS